MSSKNTSISRIRNGYLEQPFALISDIHANRPALEAVLEDIDRRNIKRVICLGDIIGYGPDPAECWQLVRKHCAIIIRGNHDQALGEKQMANFHPRAKAAIEWTRERMFEVPYGQEIMKTLISLPRTGRVSGYLFVHGSPIAPTMEYLLPGDSYDRERMAKEFAKVPQNGVAFNGHTHIPGVIVRGNPFLPPEALPNESIEILGRQAIVNVGSVGQPRDGNPKACYLTVEPGGVLCYHRVKYDMESVCKRILAIKELDPFLGQRLLAGY